MRQWEGSPPLREGLNVCETPSTVQGSLLKCGRHDVRHGSFQWSTRARMACGASHCGYGMILVTCNHSSGEMREWLSQHCSVQFAHATCHAHTVRYTQLPRLPVSSSNKKARVQKKKTSQVAEKLRNMKSKQRHTMGPLHEEFLYRHSRRGHCMAAYRINSRRWPVATMAASQAVAFMGALITHSNAQQRTARRKASEWLPKHNIQKYDGLRGSLCKVSFTEHGDIRRRPHIA